MNGWLVALIVYGAGWVITLVGAGWSMRNEPESHNEPGEDEAAFALLVFLWPITWVFFTVDFIKSRREKRTQEEQRQGS